MAYVYEFGKSLGAALATPGELLYDLQVVIDGALINMALSSVDPDDSRIQRFLDVDEKVRELRERDEFRLKKPKDDDAARTAAIENDADSVTSNATERLSSWSMDSSTYAELGQQSPLLSATEVGESIATVSSARVMHTLASSDAVAVRNRDRLHALFSKCRAFEESARAEKDLREKLDRHVKQKHKTRAASYTAAVEEAQKTREAAQEGVQSSLAECAPALYRDFKDRFILLCEELLQALKKEGSETPLPDATSPADFTNDVTMMQSSNAVVSQADVLATSAARPGIEASQLTAPSMLHIDGTSTQRSRDGVSLTSTRFSTSRTAAAIASITVQQKRDNVLMELRKIHTADTSITATTTQMQGSSALQDASSNPLPETTPCSAKETQMAKPREEHSGEQLRLSTSARPGTASPSSPVVEKTAGSRSSRSSANAPNATSDATGPPPPSSEDAERPLQTISSSSSTHARSPDGSPLPILSSEEARAPESLGSPTPPASSTGPGAAPCEAAPTPSPPPSERPSQNVQTASAERRQQKGKEKKNSERPQSDDIWFRFYYFDRVKNSAEKVPLSYDLTLDYLQRIARKTKTTLPEGIAEEIRVTRDRFNSSAAAHYRRRLEKTFNGIFAYRKQLEVLRWKLKEVKEAEKKIQKHAGPAAAELIAAVYANTSSASAGPTDDSNLTATEVSTPCAASPNAHGPAASDKSITKGTKKWLHVLDLRLMEVEAMKVAVFVNGAEQMFDFYEELLIFITRGFESFLGRLTMDLPAIGRCAPPEHQRRPSFEEADETRPGVTETSVMDAPG